MGASAARAGNEEAQLLPLGCLRPLTSPRVHESTSDVCLPPHYHRLSPTACFVFQPSPRAHLPRLRHPLSPYPSVPSGAQVNHAGRGGLIHSAGPHAGCAPRLWPDAASYPSGSELDTRARAPRSWGATESERSQAWYARETAIQPKRVEHPRGTETLSERLQPIDDGVGQRFPLRRSTLADPLNPGNRDKDLPSMTEVAVRPTLGARTQRTVQREREETQRFKHQVSVTRAKTKKAMGLARTADLSLEGQRELALLTEGLGPEARLRVLREAAPKSGKTKSWGPPLRPRLDMSIAPSSKVRSFVGDRLGIGWK